MILEQFKVRFPLFEGYNHDICTVDRCTRISHFGSKAYVKIIVTWEDTQKLSAWPFADLPAYHESLVSWHYRRNRLKGALSKM